MALMPQPLSWGDRRELAQRLRREASEKIKEAERIEKGLEQDENEVWEAIQKSRQKWAEEQRQKATGTLLEKGDRVF